MKRTGIAVLLLLLTTTPAVFAQEPGAVTPQELTLLAREAVSEESSISAAAVTALREQGPAGLAALLVECEGVLQSGPQDPAWERAARAIDAVAGQRDAWASRLFWYTDLAHARAAAQASGKPILSLRLLGRLDEELSCANSRFFRTAIYANTQIAATLRERFVLHWQSVRPVPRITIDFGDGRRLERTVTGNSIHWVLDVHGRPIDGIPGLYGPQEFLRALQDAAPQALAASSMDDLTWQAMLRRRYAGLAGGFGLRTSGTYEVREFPVALEAGVAPQSKSGIERPILARIETDPRAFRAEEGMLGRFRNPNPAVRPAKLDVSSIALMERKLGLRGAALRPMVDTFERAMAEEQGSNESRLRPMVRFWIASGPRDLDELTEQVYARVFLTPREDQWLGLLPADTYAALDRNGVVTTKPVAP